MKMFKVPGCIFLLFLTTQSLCLASSYGDDVKTDLKRGLKNIFSAPAEIAVGFQDYHEGPGRPIIRQTAGILEGSFKTFLRLVSGVWDFVELPIPGDKQGFPTRPETFF